MNIYKLPAKIYRVEYHPQRGFWFVEQNKLFDVETIYVDQVDKILRTYQASSSNSGVVLLGEKSLLARVIAQKGIENGLPVIIVDSADPGIGDFLSSIVQEAIIIFGKTFSLTRDEVKLLFNGGKRLFVITCNNLDELKRLGLRRFHYHFTDGFPYCLL